MTDQANAPAASPATPTAPVSFDARVDAIMSEIHSEATSEPAAEATEADATAASPPPASAADSDAAAKAREERQARLRAFREREAATVHERARKNEQADLAKRAGDAERRAKELEASLASRVDPASLDEAGFFDMAKKLQVNPQKLADWIREATLNPEAVAAQAAQRALDPRIQAAEERAARAESTIQQYIAQQQQATVAAREQQAAKDFVSSISAEQAPYAAKFIEAHGADEFLKVAYGALRSLPDGADQQALLDEVEEKLEAFAMTYLPAQTPAVPTASSGKPSSPSNRGAAKPTTTVSNSLAQERASVVSEDDFARLPFDERVARIRSSL